VDHIIIACSYSKLQQKQSDPTTKMERNVEYGAG